jgi:Holliday junction resolvase
VSRGIQRERDLRRLLEAEGWWTCRAAGSFGDADVVALKQGEIPRMIECKSTARGPFAHFGPADRDELISAAAKAGAIPWLVWWPPRRKPVWLHVSDWPATREEAA